MATQVVDLIPRRGDRWEYGDEIEDERGRTCVFGIVFDQFVFCAIPCGRHPSQRALHVDSFRIPSSTL